MYKITAVLTCAVCGNQIMRGVRNPVFDDGVRELSEALHLEGVNLGVSLCPECVKKAHQNLTTTCHCELCENRGE